MDLFVRGGDALATLGNGETFQQLDIEEELKDSYLTYAMSVIVSRALPDVRDGLKPSQRRILVAMNDLNLGPGSGRVKCAKISGDTSGNYHPHGDQVIYPTLVRMAQDWVTRHVLIDKQGNFGSIAGLPPAAMRYTEARLSAVAAEMLDDLKRDTVDYIPTYDERSTEPVVLPSKFPNLLVNGSSGIAVGMATSLPPHNLSEVCDAIVRVIEQPDVTIEELMQVLPGPDFPTGGIICGHGAIHRGYATGRSTLTIRARTSFEQDRRKRNQIVVSEIPYQQNRDRVMERIAQLVNDDRIKGIADVVDESDRNNPVRIVITLKRDADPDVVLNQLFRYSPLQDSFSVILLALVDGRPRTLSIKDLIQEFLRHRVTVIRRRTQYLLDQARKRKHIVEGLLIALAKIDEIIQAIRISANVPEAKARLLGLEVDAVVLKQALGDDGFASLQEERGAAESYTLTGTQADSILQMQLQRLTGLEQDKLVKEHKALMEQIADYRHILSEERNILDIVREDMFELKQKFGDRRRTEISEEEVTAIDLADLIREETMVVTLTHKGYIKRIPLDTYKSQHRGGKGIIGAKSEEEDPIEHLFVASTHDYLLFFTNRGKVYWQKIYDLPMQARSSRGRAIVNLLQLAPEEKISSCIPVREFDERRCLVMATRKGVVKKTVLSAYKRPMRGGIIAIRLDDDNELIDVVMTEPGDHLVLSTAEGMAIRFDAGQVRAVGRNSRGVRGISLSAPDELVAMVVADQQGTLLTACEHGYGKRTPFGTSPLAEGDKEQAEGDEEHEETETSEGDDAEVKSSARYRSQHRGGKGLRDIKTTERNGRVVDAVGVRDDDEVLMITAKGKVQRVAVRDISVIGRNTQGVVIIRLDADDTLVAIAKVPAEDVTDEEQVAEEAGSPAEASAPDQTESPPDRTDSAEAEEESNRDED